MMTETCNQLSAVELTFGAKLATIHRLWHFARLFLLSNAIIVEFIFLHFEMEKDPFTLGMIEHYIPLIELRAIVVHLVIAFNEWPNIITIAARIVCQE